MKQRAILCPRCKRLIGSEETICSWCGTSRSSSWWKLMSLTSGALDGDWVIKTIITVNLIFFAISLMLSIRGSGLGGFLSPSQGSLMVLGATGTYPIDYYGRYWTLISANYLHGGILHIIFNLMALSQIAPKVLVEYGTSRMFSIYTIGGVIGYIVSYMAGVPFTIGASAAVCSMIGALLYYGKSRGGVYGSALYREVSGWVISLFVFGLIFPGINNWGHGGGILGGIIVGALIGYSERRRENILDRALAMLCGLITIMVLCWAIISAYAYT